jgi:hypothetical protein
MGNPPTKGQWKELLNKEIDKYWKNEWEVEKQKIIQIGETSCWLYFCLLACKV